MPALIKAKWELIAQSLAKGSTVKDAFIAGGYNYDPAQATRMCQRPQIRARVSEILETRVSIERVANEDAAKALGIDKKWVLERLKFNCERALRGQPVLDANGVQTGKYTGRPDGATANNALKLIGMELGMFIERHEIGGPGDFSRMTDEELAKRAFEDAAALGLPAEATEALMLTFQPVVDGQSEE